MRKEYYKVELTKDYDAFKYLLGNRAITKAHITKVGRIMKKYPDLPVWILVNEDNYVIDGQHRLQAAMELGRPVGVIVIKEGDLELVQALNSSQKGWTTFQFVECYSILGIKDYQILKHFHQKWGFGWGECASMLRDRVSQVSTTDIKDGKFRVTNYQRAISIAEDIFATAQYYDGYKRRGYVLAITELSKKTNFQAKYFLESLQKQSKRMTDQLCKDDYIALIKEIYNRRRTVNRLILNER